ncbi:MAG TPA: glycosyltransferase [Nitrospira sp.]|nr:glycosyltransferase [Nitrospira sp.]
MAQDLDEYRDVAPKGTIDFLHRLSESVTGRRFIHVSTVRYGGGSAELLRRLIPILNGLGVVARWEVLAVDQEFLSVSRRLAAGLQGQDRELSDAMQQAYLDTNRRNADSLALEGDVVMIHDPQPAALVEYRKDGKWIWRCHMDLAQPQRRAWSFLRRFVLRYDAVIFSLDGFAQRLPMPKFLIYPSIDPLSAKNRELPRAEVAEVLERLAIPRDKPLLVQIAPFERLKDHLGTLKAYRLVKQHHDCRLVLAGGGVAHNPEGEAVFAEITTAARRDPDVHILQLPPEADLEINALQRAATVVVHKPIHEEFGIGISEAMWKGKPVVAGDAGGIHAQVLDGMTGFLVRSEEGLAFRVRQLLNNPGLMQRMGGAGREHVRRNFMITRHLADYLTLLNLYTSGRLA